jgi:hypothetical protein
VGVDEDQRYARRRLRPFELQLDPRFAEAYRRLTSRRMCADFVTNL